MTDVTPKAPQNEPAPQTETPPADNGGSGEKTFTQSELDKIIADRLARAQESTVKNFLQDLGVDSTDTLKASLEDYQQRKEAEMTEAEKAQQLAAAERQKREALEQEIASMKAASLTQERNAVLDNALRGAGGQDVDELRIILQAKMADRITGLFDENTASVNEASLKAFVKQVQSDHPRYFGPVGAGSPSTAGGVAPTNRAASMDQAKQDIQRKYGKL